MGVAWRIDQASGDRVVFSKLIKDIHEIGGIIFIIIYILLYIIINICIIYYYIVLCIRGAERIVGVRKFRPLFLV